MSVKQVSDWQAVDFEPEHALAQGAALQTFELLEDPDRDWRNRRRHRIPHEGEIFDAETPRQQHDHLVGLARHQGPGSQALGQLQILRENEITEIVDRMIDQ